jgi:eukaryotic-like serine/threonine-protein kinase
VTPPPEGPQRFGAYELLSLLGQGGMAEVFRARVLEGPRQGWEVALKRLLPQLQQDAESMALFAHEAALSQFLDHPNIVKVLDVGAVEQQSFIVMELVDGRDLGHIVRRCKHRHIPLPVDFAVYLGQVLLDALAYAHTALGPDGQPLGIVHCDVSPSNLFISRVGEIKLGDFGVARARVGSSHTDLLGKPYYLSPEALAGQVTPHADLWAATVVLYELLTLQRPFTGSSPEEVFDAVRRRHYLPVAQLRPEVPVALAELVDRALAPDPAQRPASAQEYACALAQLYDERIGTPLAIAAVVRGLFGAQEGA